MTLMVNVTIPATLPKWSTVLPDLPHDLNDEQCYQIYSMTLTHKFLSVISVTITKNIPQPNLAILQSSCSPHPPLLATIVGVAVDGVGGSPRPRPLIVANLELPLLLPGG